MRRLEARASRRTVKGELFQCPKSPSPELFSARVIRHPILPFGEDRRDERRLLRDYWSLKITSACMVAGIGLSFSAGWEGPDVFTYPIAAPSPRRKTLARFGPA